MNLNKIRNEILNESKSYVIKYGWNEDLLIKISKKFKYDENNIYVLFPEGYISILQFYLDQINTTMTNESKKLNLIRLKVHERIRELCILRFNIMEREKILISKTFFHLLLPNNFKFSSINLYKTVDQIWYLSGDNSTDFNFYSKRGILASIYSNTLIHFVNNDDLDSTKKLLDKSLKKVSKIPKIKNRVNDLIKLTPYFLNFKKKFNSTKQ